MFPITKNYTQGREDSIISTQNPSKIKYLFVTSILPSQHVLRGLYSCQNDIFVLILPIPELGKISTLVVGNISTIGTRLWKHIQISISN